MSFTNLLLNRLPASSLAELTPHFSAVDLHIHHVLERRGEDVEHVHFVEEGLLSILSEYENGREVEVGIVGREGFSNIGSVLGDTTAVFKTNVQVAGRAIRIPAQVFADIVEGNPHLRKLLLLYVRSLEIQMASTASANGRAKLEQRLSRWILMVQDRLDSDVFSITHQFLAQMLCARRPGVTVALHLLEGKGLIKSTRGQIAVLDRNSLLDLADGSYGLAEAEYARLLGEDFRQARAPGAAVKAQLQKTLFRNGLF